MEDQAAPSPTKHGLKDCKAQESSLKQFQASDLFVLSHREDQSRGKAAAGMKGGRAGVSAGTAVPDERIGVTSREQHRKSRQLYK